MTQEKETVLLRHKGIITFEEIENLLLLFKGEIHSFDTKLVIQKRIYSILVECLENSYRHNVVINDIPKEILVEVVFIKDKNNFEIRIGNYISNDDIDLLIDKIDIVNSLGKKGLNRLYRKSILKSNISEKGGAGLGIIEIARNSGQLLNYELSSEQDFFTFFKIIVSVSKNQKNFLAMTPLIIEETIATPKVVFDYDNNNFILEGCSRPEDVRGFFNPIIQWIIGFKKFIDSDNTEINKSNLTIFKFNFDYFNSSSAKFILDILVLIDDIHSAGLNVRIDWHYDEDDDDMKEVGEELSEVVDFPFEYVITRDNAKI